jgi:hypothetical protein
VYLAVFSDEGVSPALRGLLEANIRNHGLDEETRDRIGVACFRLLYHRVAEDIQDHLWRLFKRDPGKIRIS